MRKLIIYIRLFPITEYQIQLIRQQHESHHISVICDRKPNRATLRRWKLFEPGFYICAVLDSEAA
jgi:hypothetical protein